MQVQVNTDKTIPGSESLDSQVQAAVESVLGRFSERVTRVEVHLTDDNGTKTRGTDKRCVLEARPANMKPVSVSHVAESVIQAVDGATKKMARHLDDTFKKIQTLERRPNPGPGRKS